MIRKQLYLDERHERMLKQRAAEQGVRSGPGDLDLIVYSLLGDGHHARVNQPEREVRVARAELAHPLPLLT